LIDYRCLYLFRKEQLKSTQATSAIDQAMEVSLLARQLGVIAKQLMEPFKLLNRVACAYSTIGQLLASEVMLKSCLNKTPFSS
jgi:hypothetical protein